MNFHAILLDPTIALFLPDFHGVVASARHETFHVCSDAIRCRRVLFSALIECGFRDCRWAPAQCVASDCVGVWNLLVLKHSGLGVACENGNRSVGTAAGQDQAVFGRCKADAVHRRVVVAVLVPLVPLAVCFLPDDDFAIVAAARQDVAEARMSPCNLPNGSAVSFQIGFQTLSAVLDVEDLR